MSALSLCITRWRNIVEQAYDFSLQYHYRFDEGKQEINVELRNDSVPIDFFSKNIEVLCLTGKNGSGKSGIMGILNLPGSELEVGQPVAYGVDASSCAFCYIFSRYDYLYVVKVDNGKVTGLWQTMYKLRNDRVNRLRCKPIKSTPVVNTWYYASNNLQLSFSGNRVSRHDLSISYRRRNKSHAGPDEVFYFYEAMGHIYLEEKMASRSFAWRVQRSWYQHFSDIEITLPVDLQLHDKKRYVATLVALKLICGVAQSYEDKKFFWKKINADSTGGGNIVPNYSSLLNHIRLIESESSAFKLLNEFRPLCDYLFSVEPSELVKSLFSMQQGGFTRYGTVRYAFSPSRRDDGPFQEILSVMAKINEKISETRFTIDPPFSTGEWKFIDLHATLHRKAKDAKTRKIDMQLLLDEPDSDLHPDLQTSLIKSMLDSLSIYSDSEFAPNFQIIISSHNPIVVSDLPSASVIPIEPPAVKLGKTFGSNIYDLYKHRFFMKSSVGVFASNKIREMLDNDKINEEMLRFLIAETGEPVLVHALQGKLAELNMIEEEDINQFISKLTKQQREFVKGKLNER